MAVFDPSEQRMCVRVVYDGPAGAGKTTNIHQLGVLFASQRRTDVSSPAELRGRTLYFDWMQIAAGAVCGFPLICQIVTVPGQAALSARRRELLSSADVVVVVVDSTPDGIERAREALELNASGGRGDTPFVLQANKQDRRTAMGAEAIKSAFHMPDTHVVEAIATEGIGVVDTFVAAVRAASRSIQARVESSVVKLDVRRIEDEHDLLGRLATVEVDRDGAAEMLLEEAAAELVVDGTGPGEITAPASAAKAPIAEAQAAPLPTADVPTGFVWPAHTGRELLRALDLSGDVALHRGVVDHSVGKTVLSTRVDRRFADADEARQALVRSARERTQLESLLVRDTVLVIQPAGDGTLWLWTLTPWTQHITDWLAGDAARLTTLATMVADAAAATLAHGAAFTPSLDAFGVDDGRVRYAGALGSAEDPPRSALDVLFAVVDGVAAAGHDADVLVDAMTHRLRDRVPHGELAKLASACPDVADSVTKPAKERLVRAIQRIALAA